MVGGNQEQVVRPKLRKRAGKPSVNLLKGGGVALRIIAMAIEHIEIDKIHKAEAMKRPSQQSTGFFESLGIPMPP